MTQIKIQQFEGPLDLLLSLIEQQQLDITQISLAHVTEQFLGYVKELEKIDATQIADYLGIAAKLLVIKSKAILPSLEVESLDEEPEEDLTEKLLRYKQFKEAAKYFKQLDARGLQSFTRTRVFSERINFWPDPAVTSGTLRTSIGAVLDSLKELDNLPKAKIKEAISIQEKIQTLQTKLSGQIETKMSDLIKNAKNKEEVIITFLALLELIKQRMFSVNQNELFTDITITQYTVSETEPQEAEPENNDII
ncbi:MAG TPA: ScpA family protein [Patescibacteria group bacterium]|jgi:segregation and condensation protein A|nr:ScpA family protein [Patescibacteria group bacterium]